MRAVFPLLIVLLALLPVPGHAADGAWAQADASQLWRSDAWLKLGHYKQSGADTWRSRTRDAHFFLAPNGAHDPRAELQATLEAFAAPAESGNDHAQCRFPARLAWARDALVLGELPQPECAAWREFRGEIPATQAVLVFPSYYLNSPSSMFGHTLLRLDPANAERGSEYLSYAVNFGANINPSDGGLFYAFKGVSGGYPGQFVVDHYYKKIQEYNRDENRDIWEYRLNLDAAETERLIRHLWELQSVKFDYYFFDENCSYRVLELLEIARPGVDLTSGFPLTAIPIDTVRAVQRAGMTGDKRFRPAMGTVLKGRLAALPPELNERVIELGQNPDRLADDDLQALDPATRARLVEAAYKYLRYRQNGAERDPTIAQRSFRLLQDLQKAAPELPGDDVVVDPDTSPDRSHGSRRIAVGAWSEDGHEYLSLGLRLSLHSLPENRNGFPAGAQINLGNFEARVDEDGDVDLNRFDVLDIFSLTPRDAFFKPLSWSVNAGIDRQWTGSREHRVAQVNSGIGAARTLFGDNMVYGLVTARVENNYGFEDPLQPAIGLRSGVLFDAGRLTLQWEAAAEKFANGATRTRVQLMNNWRLSQQQALHLELLWRDQGADDTDDTLAVGLRYQYYY